jgi:enoyl-CoA hydratase/carnithine racemase
VIDVPNYNTLSLQRDGPVLTVLLNRPDKRNAINREMHNEVQAVCQDLLTDFDTRVVILAGAGGAFSSGADTSEWGKPGPDNELELRHQSGIGSRTCAAIEALDQITIAAVHGFAVGGGAVIAACCDFRVAGRGAWFSIPEVELGIPLSWNALPRLAREVGHARALELTILCERINAQQAHDYGLVTHVVDDGQELSAARDLAAKVIAKPPLPVALTKASMKAIRRATEQGEVAYSDGDLLLYSRLMQQRARRRGRENE